MTINNNETPDVSRLNLDQASLGKTQSSARAGLAVSSNQAASSTPEDSLSLSNSQDLVQQALNGSSASRDARVQELKALVANNQYEPNAQEVSSAIINAHLAGD
jgi:anti-sigma28 factor (negative regulator of flagellin synthesis)